MVVQRSSREEHRGDRRRSAQNPAVAECSGEVARPRGFEPLTFAFGGECPMALNEINELTRIADHEIAASSPRTYALAVRHVLEILHLWPNQQFVMSATLHDDHRTD